MKDLIIGGTDIETTGLSQEDGHRIVEVAVKLYQYSPSKKTHKAIYQYETRINPGRSIDPGAQAVHGISFEMLESAPRWDAVAPQLAKVLSKCDAGVGHNGDGFDFPFIGNELLRAGVAVPDLKTIDTMLQAPWATPLGKLPNLRELCFACGVDYDPAKAHAAMYDVEVMMECLFIGLNDGFFTIPQELYMGIAA